MRREAKNSSRPSYIFYHRGNFKSRRVRESGKLRCGFRFVMIFRHDSGVNQRLAFPKFETPSFNLWFFGEFSGSVLASG